MQCHPVVPFGLFPAVKFKMIYERSGQQESLKFVY